MDYSRQTTEQKIVERSTDVTYAHNLSGNFTFLSEEGERISGYSCEEACRMNIAELLDPEIAGRACEQIMGDVTKRIGTVYEIDLIAKDGQSVSLEVSTRVVVRDGEPIEIQGIAVPSVIRSQSRSSLRARCLDESFYFRSSPDAPDIIVRSF
jgi:two-component system cell cycle sensor histidine kinase/response regulator CckA